MVLAIDKAHRRLYCGLGPDAYANSVHLAGFSGVGLISKVKEVLDNCNTCSLSKMVMTKKSPISKLLLSERGPDDFIKNCLTEDVMQYVVLDEAGPFFLTSQSQKLEQVYLLITVELVTYRAHLIPMQDISAKGLIRALEQLHAI